MKASLGILKDAMGRKVAVLGDMGELGANEKELHREVGTFAGTCGIDLLICVGTLAKEIAEAAKAQLGYELDKKKLQLSAPIKELGTTMVPIKLHPKVTGELKVVVKEA